MQESYLQELFDTRILPVAAVQRHPRPAGDQILCAEHARLVQCAQWPENCGHTSNLVLSKYIRSTPSEFLYDVFVQPALRTVPGGLFI